MLLILQFCLLNESIPRQCLWRLQKSEEAPPPPESPPPNWTLGLLVCGFGVIECGDTRPNAAAPALIQCLSFAERRWAVKPCRIPLGTSATQRRMKRATPINNA